MKLALVLLFLGTAFVASEACIRICYWRVVYIRVCNAYWCRLIAVRRLVCVYRGCFGKRSTQPEIKVGFPCNFTEYDKNGNGQIDLKEFKTTLKMSNSTDLLESFKEWDKTKDGVISCSEFLNSEHEFECKPYGCTA